MKNGDDGNSLQVTGVGFGASSSSSTSATGAAAPTAASDEQNTKKKKKKRERREKRERRIHGTTATTAAATTTTTTPDVTTSEVREDAFTSGNRFSGFDPSAQATFDSENAMLNALLSRPTWFNPSAQASFADRTATFDALLKSSNNYEGDDEEDEVWGVGDETDEHMQKLLEASYAAAANTGGGQDMDEMMQEAIKRSLEAEDEVAFLDDEVIQLQFESLFEHYPEDLVARTMTIFQDLRENYEKSGGLCPSVDRALEMAQQAEKQQELLEKQQEEQQKQEERKELEKVQVDLEFEELLATYPEQVVQEAREIYDNFVERKESIDYCVGLAMDRAKERKKQLEQERQQETREQRAARFAAMYDNKK